MNILRSVILISVSMFFLSGCTHYVNPNSIEYHSGKKVYGKLVNSAYLLRGEQVDVLIEADEDYKFIAIGTVNSMTGRIDLKLKSASKYFNGDYYNSTEIKGYVVYASDDVLGIPFNIKDINGKKFAYLNSQDEFKMKVELNNKKIVYVVIEKMVLMKIKLK